MKQKITLVFLIGLMSCFAFVSGQQAPGISWFSAANGANSSYTNKVLTSPDGTSFVSGYFYSSFTLGDQTVSGNTYSESQSSFLARYSSDGNVMWVKSIYGAGSSYSYLELRKMFLAEDSSLYLVYQASCDSVVLPDGTSKLVNSNPYGYSCLMVKIDPETGNQMGISVIHGASSSGLSFFDAALDSDGNLYVTGTIQSDYIYWSNEQDSVSTQGYAYNNAFLAKYPSSLGDPVWTKLFSTNTTYPMYKYTGDLYGNKLAINPLDGGVVLLGAMGGEKVWQQPGDTLYQAGGEDSFIAGFSTDGTEQFLNLLGGSSDDISDALTFDDEGNFYVAGASMSDTVKCGTYSLALAGETYNGYLIKFQPDGTPVKGITINSGLSYVSSGSEDHDVVVYDTLNKSIIWSTYFYSNELQADTITITHLGPSGNGNNLLLCNVNKSLDHIAWAKNIGSTYDVSASAVDVTSKGVYIALSTYYDIYFSQDTLSNPMQQTGFAIVYYNVAGQRKWMFYHIPTETVSGGIYMNDMTVGKNGLLYVAGAYSSSSSIDLGGVTLPATEVESALTWEMGWNIHGNVYTSTLQPVTSGYAKLFGISLDTRGFAIDSVGISDGSYNFTTAPYSGFVIYAEGDPDAYPDQMGTYYGNMTRWVNAPVFNLDTATSKSYDIYLQERPTLTGTGIVSGTITYEIDLLDLKSHQLKSTYGRPVKSASVVLVGRTKGSGENIIAQTVTDELGFYQFASIPEGNYSVIADIPGFAQLQTYDISLTSLITDVTNLNYVVTEAGILYGINPVTEHITASGIELYPNPTTGKIRIATGETMENLRLEVYNLAGQMVHSHSWEGKVASVDDDLSGLPAGVYTCRILSNQKVEVQKLVIQ